MSHRAIAAWRDLGAATAVAFAVGALAAFAMPLLGCGSDDGFSGEEAEVAAVIERYKDAVADRDSATICEELLAPESIPDGIERCRRAWDEALSRPLSKESPKPERLEIEAIVIDDGRARVTYTSWPGYTNLVEQDGRWYVELVQ